jgi:hypothetical protein
VQVRRDEGVAIRIDREPCAVVRKDDSEASVGQRIGLPLSLAKIHIWAPTLLRRRKATWTGASTRAFGQPGVVVELEPGDPTSGLCLQSALVRIGEARSRSR